MKLNKQMFFDKLRKVRNAGAVHLRVAHTSQAVRLTYSLNDVDCFDLLMTTRNIQVRDVWKENRRADAVNDAALLYRRWLNEWSATNG